METRSSIIAVIGVIVLVVLVILGIRYAGRTQAVDTAATTTTPVATTTTQSDPKLAAIKSFEDCAATGYPIAETHPRQCLLPDGRTYAEEIQQQPSYNNATRDMIYVSNPYPGAVVGKTFKVTGAARGNWYFEASFPVEVLDKNGKVLAQKPAQAQGDWMTEDFVPFSADITVPDSYIGPARIILRKDNPSGDPSRDAALTIPITIEY
jgi:hypothetical protein